MQHKPQPTQVNPQSSVDGFLDVREQLIASKVTNEAERVEAERKMKAVEEFLEEPYNKSRLMKWQRENPGRVPPVYYIEEKDQVVWLNRAQIRNLQKRARKAGGLDSLAQLRTRAQDHSARSSSSTQPETKTKHPKGEDDERRSATTTTAETRAKTTDVSRDRSDAEEGGNGPARESDLCEPGTRAQEL
jgi:hypothetical protein